MLIAALVLTGLLPVHGAHRYAPPVRRSAPVQARPVNAEATFDALFVDASALQRAGDHAGAVEGFRQALSFLPDKGKSASCWNDLGWSLFVLTRYTEAADAFRQAVKLRPDFEMAKNNLAMVERVLAQQKEKAAKAKAESAPPAPAPAPKK